MIDLTTFCEPEHHALGKPWSIGPYTYAARQIVGIRVPRRDDVPENDMAPDFEKLLREAPPMTNPAPLPRFAPSTLPETAACEACAGLGYLRTCSACNGTGEDACGCCGNDVDCSICKGVGATKIDPANIELRRADKHAIECEKCDGRGEVKSLYYCRIAEQMYVQPTVILALAALPGLVIDTRPFDGNGHRFTCDGGEGLFMPLRPPSSEHGKPIILPIEEAAAA